MHRGSRIFEELKSLGLLEIMKGEPGAYMRMSSPGMMDLHVDYLYPGRIAMAHNGVQNGDKMADPDMEIEINCATKEAHAKTWQNDYVGIYHEVSNDDPKDPLQAELDEFLLGWLSNIKNQGYEHVMQEMRA